MHEPKSSSALGILDDSSEESAYHAPVSAPISVDQRPVRPFLDRLLRYFFYALLAVVWLVILAYLAAAAWTLYLMTQSGPHWYNDLVAVLWRMLRPGILANDITSPLLLGAFLLVYAALFFSCIWVTLFAFRHRRIHHPLNPGDGPVLLGDAWFDPDHDFNRTIMRGIGDPLDYERRATVIAKTIARSVTRTPFAIAIEGRWGIGKTTLMNMIERKLRGATFILHDENGRKTSWKCFTIWFNPWRHRRWDAQKAFMSAVFADIPWQALRWYVGPVMRTRVLSQVANFISFVRGGLGNRLVNKLDVNAAYRNKFRTEFERFLAYWSKAEGKTGVALVIFVDDLDRCKTSDIAGILEAMKLFFDTQQCIFVLGFDPAVVSRSIARELHGNIPEGLEYLEKLVQVEFQLYQPDDARLLTLIEKFEAAMQLQKFFMVIERDDGDYRKRILECAQRTPRKIKRLLNAVAMMTPLHTEDEYSTLFLLILLQVRWPLMSQQLIHAAERGNLSELLRRILAYIEEFEKSS